MSYDGYFTLDGAEFANFARFTAYAGDHGWWQSDAHDLILSDALEETYTDPVTDLAPWYDADDPISGDFYGFYPLSVTGLEDSSRQGDVVESTLDGGVPGRIRHATKEVVFSGIIAGAGEEACEYGMRWLRRTLLGAVCSPLDARKQALGAELTYFAAEPVVTEDDTAQQVRDRLTRVRRKVAVTRGPLVNSTKKLTCGDVLFAVTFTATIGDPMVYWATKRIFTSLFDGDFAWAIEPEGDVVDAVPFAEVVCGDPTYQPLFDPECAIVLSPPTVPNVPLSCWTPSPVDEEWQRAYVRLPTDLFTTWGEAVPVITIQNVTETLRDLRIRFFPDLDGTFDPTEDEPCSFISDIVVSYLPVGIMVIDGRSEDVHFTTAGGTTKRADSLLFSSNLRPIDWPVLACGTGYVMSIDWRGAAIDLVFPVIDLDLIPRAV